MHVYRRELLISRICSGVVHLHLPPTLVLRKPSKEAIYYANELFVELLNQAELADLFTEDELKDFLYESHFWDEDLQKALEKLPEEIDDLKASLYECIFQSVKKKAVRKQLRDAKERLSDLFSQRHAYDHMSCMGFASAGKARRVMALSLTDMAGLPAGEANVDAAMNALAESRISEAEYRELARTEPWRSIWACRKMEGSLFGVPAVDLTEEQQSLVGWSSLFDSVHEHPECPSEDVFADDDAFDGWLVIQKRKREEKGKIAAAEAIENDKIRNSGEVFIVADTVEDAKRIQAMNDPHTNAILSQKFAHIAKVGQVDEADLPDVRRKNRMAAVSAMKERLG